MLCCRGACLWGADPQSDALETWPGWLRCRERAPWWDGVPTGPLQFAPCRLLSHDPATMARPGGVPRALPLTPGRRRRRRRGARAPPPRACRGGRSRRDPAARMSAPWRGRWPPSAPPAAAAAAPRTAPSPRPRPDPAPGARGPPGGGFRCLHTVKSPPHKNRYTCTLVERTFPGLGGPSIWDIGNPTIFISFFFGVYGFGVAIWCLASSSRGCSYTCAYSGHMHLCADACTYSGHVPLLEGGVL